jgi:adenylate cyclase
MRSDAGPDLRPLQRLTWPGFVLDLGAGELLAGDGRPTELRAQALKVLLILGERAGRVVGKDELMRRVWGDVIVTEDSLVQAVGDIRRVLGDDARRVIQTVARRGYRLIAGDSGAPAARGSGGVQEPSDFAAPGHLSPMRPTVAVIPWLSRAYDASRFGAGDLLADEVIGALSRSDDLYVVSRLSTAVFRRHVGALADVRRALGADYVVAGGYHLSGRTLHVSIEVTDTANSRVLFADRLEGDLGELLAGQSVLVAQIVRAAGDAIVRHQLERLGSAPLGSLERYTLLMAAVSLVHRATPADFERARIILEHLIAYDPHHPIPRAWLAKWHVLRVQQGWSTDVARDATLAHDQTKAALDSDPECGLALTVDGFVNCVLLKDFDAAGESYARALEVNPNESLAWLFKGAMHSFKGEGAAAMQSAERALKLSPLDPVRYLYDALAASAAVSAGRYEDGLELAQRSWRANRRFASSLRAIVIAQVLLGRLNEARQSARALLQLEPTLTASGYLRRHPSGAYPIGKVWSEALRTAGVPH